MGSFRPLAPEPAPDIAHDDPNASTRMLWAQLTEPLDTIEAAHALFGLPPVITRQLIGAVLATSVEAEQLLAAMPGIIRSLSIATTDTPVRCQGELRGAVLWSETLAARSATAGATDVFVCSSAARAYDTAENRVLVAALQAIVRGSSAADAVAHQAYDDEILLRARENGVSARHFMDHRALGMVRRRRPDARAIAKTRAGTRRRVYAPALSLLDRARHPIGINHLLAFSDPRTAWQHWVVLALMQRLRAAGHPLPVFRTTPAGDLRAGRLVYRHPRTAAMAEMPLHGILFERLLIDVPDPIDRHDLDVAAAELGERARGKAPFLVTTEADLDRVVEFALRSLS